MNGKLKVLICLVLIVALVGIVYAGSSSSQNAPGQTKKPPKPTTIPTTIPTSITTTIQTTVPTTIPTSIPTTILTTVPTTVPTTTIPTDSPIGSLFPSGTVFYDGVTIGYAIDGIEMPNGLLFASWMNGIEGANSEYIVGAYSSDGIHWGTPKILARDPTLAITEPHMIEYNGKVYLFYSKYDATNLNAPAYIMYKTTTDSGATWSEPTTVGTGAYQIVSDHPIVLSSGKILLPLYFRDGSYYKASMYSSIDGMATWQRGQTVSVDGDSMVEPGLVQLDNGNIVMLLRDYTHAMWVDYSVSADDGVTWSEPVASGINSNSQRPNVHKLSTGEIIYVWNDVQSSVNLPRNPWTIAILNESATGITYHRDLYETPNKNTDLYSNGAIIERSDGTLIALVSFNRGGTNPTDLWTYSTPLTVNDIISQSESIGG